MTIANPVLYNAAAAGFLAGIQSRRLQTLEANSVTPVAPIDFNSLNQAAFVFAGEVDTLIQALPSGTAATNIAKIAAANATVVPSTAAISNMAETLPPALAAICKAAWDSRSYPLYNAAGTLFAAADYQTIANACVSLFAEFAASVTVV